MLETTTANERRLNSSCFMMQHGCRLVYFSAWGLLVLGMIYGCQGNGNRDMDEKVLIRAGSSVVTVRAFHEAFESNVTSPSRLFQDPDALREQKYRILNRLIEELLILERAKELNLQVSDEETTQVVNSLKKDFPDDTFEKTLMENGISFLTWEKALKRRLLMEKVIRQDLSERAFSTPLTVNEVRETDNVESPPESETVTADDSEGETLPLNKDLSGTTDQMSGVEAEYPLWINRLKQQYAIEIDWKLWEIIEQEQTDDI